MSFQGKKAKKYRGLSTLSFDIEFPYDKDEVYLAYCYPYTYTDLQIYLDYIHFSLHHSLPTSCHQNKSIESSRKPESQSSSPFLDKFNNIATIESKDKYEFSELYYRRDLLCTTLAGNRCDILTITNKSPTESHFNSKKVIFLTARVHPGESNASFIIHGIINYLVFGVQLIPASNITESGEEAVVSLLVGSGAAPNIFWPTHSPSSTSC